MDAPAFSTCRKRLLNEATIHKHLILSPLEYNAEKRLQWTLQIPGPKGSPYQDQNYFLEIAYDSSYPFSAPYLRFATPIFHPNIHPSGRMSNLMIECWSPLLTVQKLYDDAQKLLAKPLKEFPYNEEADELWNTNRMEFQRKVAEVYSGST
jgi:ubiquitin-protein ligase